MARFFYALRPDAQAAGALGRLAAGLAAPLGGRALGAHDIHLTLVFVGERPAGDAPTLAGIMTGLAPSAQPLALARLGSFGRGLLWAGPARAPATPAGDAGMPAHASPAPPPDWPLGLAAELQRRLRAAGIGFDERTLQLHATLVRGAANRRRGAPPAFDEFAHALPIVPAGWTLVLGRSDGDSTPQRRYRWEPPAAVIASSHGRHRLAP
ncbi:MAG: hypothetical protein KJ011_10285 [Burkholderiaceae bacterium]|nr:hypothetical protein [Burkholderiaceae bacterium]